MGFTGIVAVSVNGRPPLYAGFGDNAAADGRPDKDTLVDIGSITKTITGAAAMKLVDQGKLSMADRLSDFFPNTPEDKARITIHQLLTHSAGFTDAVGDDLEYLSKGDFMIRAMDSSLLFEPGSGYAYSNVGFSLAAAIIEKVAGKSYADFLKDDVLRQAGITKIGYDKTFDARRSLLTQDGRAIDDASWGGSAHWALFGNGGLVATAKDMIRFREAFVSGKVVSNAGIELAQAPLVREGEGVPSHYGYGLVIQDEPLLGRTYWHNGGNPHFTSNLTDYSDYGLVIFTASNNPDINADIAAMVITEMLFDVKIFQMDATDSN
ncbi:serine hydrolase [Hyphococcus flavus]|uniref:Serine hydrolase n=1 Tax=Hyphococcus flavus TaxID=1866326 RepID=A0AAE9ZDW1_9PROT|nr:serine hydrolase domain-containing protein [Hyphococcus flavus]WDI31162.1 serine hydrolase [Hyphococcus flavus]